MDQHGLVLTVVVQAFEEYTTGQQGELKRLEIDTDSIAVPGIGSNPVRDKAREEAIEIEQEQDGSAKKSIISSSLDNVIVGTYKMKETIYHRRKTLYRLDGVWIVIQTLLAIESAHQLKLPSWRLNDRGISVCSAMPLDALA